ncbi:hypothetical protein K8R78_07030 [bacterium]|nr:hypothetical protein [bacterium]
MNPSPSASELLNRPPAWLVEGRAIHRFRRITSARNLAKPGRFRPSSTERVVLRARLAPLLELLGESPLHVEIDSPKKAQWWAAYLLEQPFRLGSQLYLSTELDRWLVLTGDDHARFSAVENGEAAEQASHTIDEFEEQFEQIGEPAHSKLFGYLTASPKLAGLGRRVERLLQLPLLSATDYLDKVLAAVTQFGFNGRLVNPPGSALYLFGNLTAQGYSREELHFQAFQVEGILSRAEEAARRQLLDQRREWLLDQIGRGLGLLTNARLLEKTEAATALTWLILAQELELESADLPPRGQLLRQLWLLQSPLASKEGKDEEKPSRTRARQLREELFGGK